MSTFTGKSEGMGGLTVLDVISVVKKIENRYFYLKIQLWRS